MREKPNLLTEEEKKWLLNLSECLVKDILEDKLGGYSGVNRPYHAFHMFKVAIERLGKRDVGLQWTYNQLKEIGLKD